MSEIDSSSQEVEEHESKTQDVHGVENSEVESKSGAQSKADSAQSAAESYADTQDNNVESNATSYTDNEISNHAGNSGAHHSRYSDSEAASAAPVQSVNGSTGNVNTFSPTLVAEGTITPDDQVVTDIKYNLKDVILVTPNNTFTVYQNADTPVIVAVGDSGTSFYDLSYEVYKT